MPFPDFSVLLLSDRVIVDRVTYESLMSGTHDPFYGPTAEVIRVLNQEGFIRLEDFESLVQQRSALIEQMLKHDMRRMSDWKKPLQESSQIWSEFFLRVTNHRSVETSNLARMWEIHAKTIVHDFRSLWPLEETNSKDKHILLHALHGSPHSIDGLSLDQGSIKENTKEIIRDYLSYINTNLVLSSMLGCGFHDWDDFEPFYRRKFLNIGRTKSSEAERSEQVKALFEVSFPEFNTWDTKRLIRILRDRRLTDLRSLVDQAARGEVVFDEEFGRRTLYEVLQRERKVGRLRTLVSYVTLPIGFLPWPSLVTTPLQKVVEEAAGHLIDWRSRQSFRWFYLISDGLGTL